MKSANKTKKIGKKQAKPKKVVSDQLNELNSCINLGAIKKAISEQHGSVYQYCKAHDILLPEMSRFLNKKVSPSLKKLYKHAQNLNLKVVITLKER